MFGYYLQQAIRNLKRTPVLTALMVLAIAVGIGASITMLTVFHVLSGNPMPDKGGRLFYVQLDPRPASSYHAGDEPSAQMTRRDAQTLLAQHRGRHQALMSAGSVAIEPASSTLAPFLGEARYTSAEFFPMFDVPFAAGHPWNGRDDTAHARVAVLGPALARKLYGTADAAIGHMLSVNGHGLRVIGVLGDWHPNPRFYDLSNQQYGDIEDVFVPFSTSRDLRLVAAGNLNCWNSAPPDDPEGNLSLDAPCTWLQYWVELDTPAQVAGYRSYLLDYSAQQREAGRFQRPANVRLYDVAGWLDHNHVVPDDVRLQTWLALGVLGICLLNTVGLMLARFLRRSGEIGVRRALGASRRAILAQCMVEAGSIGVVGGMLGLGLAELGLWVVRRQPAAYAPLAHMDLTMLLATFALAVASSLAAGWIPALRAMRIAPALQLKSQ